MKILTDEAVNSWKYNIHYCILNSCAKFMQLCASHLKRDNSYLLELLSVVLDPDNKFNTFNISRQATIPVVASLAANAKNENSVGQTPAISTVPSTTTPTTTTTITTITPTANTQSTTPTPGNIFDDLMIIFFQLNANNDNLFSDFSIVTQTQDANEENTTQSSLTSTPVTSKPSSSPVNSTVTVTHRQLPTIQPRENNENASTIARNQLNNAWHALTEDQIYAKSPPEPHHPRGWLVDLINRYV